MPVLHTRLFAALVLAVLLARASGDATAGKVAWLMKNAIALQSVDPKDDDFADLRPLRQSIGNCRIVMLGGSHDPAVLNAKYRLVRFLHEELGFDVLAADATLFEAEAIDRSLSQGKLPSDSLRLIASFAFGSPVGGNILGYARAADLGEHPLHIGGFGPHDSGSLGSYVKQLFKFIDRIDANLVPPADRKKIKSVVSAADARMPFGRVNPWAENLPGALDALDRLDKNLSLLPANDPSAREVAFYRHTLADFADSATFRIGGMAVMRRSNRLLWYARFWRPNSKIVVWSSNVLIGRNLTASFGGGRRPFSRIIGESLAQGFGVSAYSIAITELKKTDSIPEILVAAPQPHLAPVDNNFESLLHAIGKPYVFIDFRTLPEDHWLRQKLTARFVNNAETAVWPEYFDAALGIDLTALPNKK